MPEVYNYETEKKWVLSDEGSRKFLRFRDDARKLIQTSGAITGPRLSALIRGGDSFQMRALIDRLCELGEIREIPNNGPPVYVDSGLGKTSE